MCWGAACKLLAPPSPSFHAKRARMNDHLIEEVGEKLRGMMHWAQNDRLVDKARN